VRHRTSDRRAAAALLPIAIGLLLLGCDDLALRTYIMVRAMGGIYVDVTTGADGSAGTRETPKKTIQAAIQYFIDKGISGDVRVAEGVYLVQYDAGTFVQVREGVSLYGGYSAGFGTRDPAVYETKIVDQSTTGGTLTEPNRAVDVPAGVTGATVIDGFTIQGGGGDYAGAVFCSSSSPTVSDNKIIGGAAQTDSFGIYSYDADPHIVNNREINGGSAVGWVAIAVYNYAGAAPVIENNYIFGGTGPRTAGVVSESGTAPVINANTIHGGEGTTQADGIQDNGSAAKIWNNLISGGTGCNFSAGIRCFFTCTAQIYNNTINGGGGTSAQGISLSDGGTPATIPTPFIRNNIVFTAGGGFCLYEQHTNPGNPQAVDNNALWDNGGTTILYRRAVGGTTDYDTAATVNGLAWADSNNESAPVFVDIDGSDNVLNTLADNDWHLTAACPSEIRIGGLDLIAVFRYDRDGTLRTGNGALYWSMGAFEY